MSLLSAVMKEQPDKVGASDLAILAETLEKEMAEGRYDAIPLEDLQRMMAVLCKIYAALLEEEAADLPVLSTAE